MILTKDNIFDEIEKKNYLEVLRSDLVDKVKDKDKDKYGWTPLHWLAWKGVKDVLDHPSVDLVKTNYGQTPLHTLAYKGHLTKEDLRKRFPWYKKEIKDLEEAITEIVNTPDSIRFILED